MMQVINEVLPSGNRLECDDPARPCFADCSPFGESKNIIDERIKVLGIAWVRVDFPGGNNFISSTPVDIDHDRRRNLGGKNCASRKTASKCAGGRPIKSVGD